jgi:hypothetical protein
MSVVTAEEALPGLIQPAWLNLFLDITLNDE